MWANKQDINKLYRMQCAMADDFEVVIKRLKEIDAGITAIVAENSKANKPKSFKKHTIKFMDDKHDEKIIARRKSS